ncbi:MAG: hypothetical protein AB9891_04685 [Anaerolineaceae bacterium]
MSQRQEPALPAPPLSPGSGTRLATNNFESQPRNTYSGSCFYTEFIQLFTGFVVIYIVEQVVGFYRIESFLQVEIASFSRFGVIYYMKKPSLAGRYGVFWKERQFKMVSVYIAAFIISIVFAAMSLVGLETNP